jgi:hypothetical protein
VSGCYWFNITITGALDNWSYEQLINAYLNQTFETDANGTLNFTYGNSSTTEFVLVAQAIDAPIGGDDNETTSLALTPPLILMVAGGVILVIGLIAWRPEIIIIGGIIFVIFALLGGYLPVVI